MGSDVNSGFYFWNVFLFQSTLPLWGVTAKVTEFTLNLKTKFMTFETKTNCETLQSYVYCLCSNEKKYFSGANLLAIP